MSASTPRRPRAGFTLVELVLAAGLFSLLIVVLLKLVDTSVTIWGRTDENRELAEIGGAVMELLSDDVNALEGGQRGDLVADWRYFDLDKDGLASAPGQRLRLVRHLDAAGLQRLAGAEGAGPLETFERGRIEVAWALLPGPAANPDERPIGTLVRGERRLDDEDTLSFFDRGFFGPSGQPVPGALFEVAGGVLWFEILCATQTTILHDGWELGADLKHASASWDAWNKGRPEVEAAALNLAPTGMPQAKDVPLLPRRVRIALELERPRDLRLRTRLTQAVNVQDGTLVVRDGRKLPAPGALILVDEEWMEVVAVNEGRVSVRRGQRSTRAATHAAEALVHHGWRLVREVPVDMTREDWDL